MLKETDYPVTCPPDVAVRQLRGAARAGDVHRDSDEDRILLYLTKLPLVRTLRCVLRRWSRSQKIKTLKVWKWSLGTACRLQTLYSTVIATKKYAYNHRTLDTRHTFHTSQSTAKAWWMTIQFSFTNFVWTLHDLETEDGIETSRDVKSMLNEYVSL